MNVAIVDKSGVFRTPVFDEILSGTTVQHAMKLLANAAVTVEQAVISEDELKAASEVMLLAGDSHIFPIISVDGIKIGDGTVGALTRKVITLLSAELANGTSDHLTVNY